jgi:streptogramin lyase
MVFDKYNNLWIAEHLTNQITVMNPITGEQKGVEIPTSNPFVQYLTTDETGQVWFAEQRGGGLARVDTTVDSMAPPLSSQPNSLTGSAVNNDKGIFEFVAGIGFEKFVAPFIALGIIFVSIMYVRTTIAYSNSLQYVNKIQPYQKEKV